MITFDIKPGSSVKHKGQSFVVARIVDLISVILEDEQGKVQKVLISELEPGLDNNASAPKDVSTIKDRDWEIAQLRFSIIQPILNSEKQRQAISEQSKKYNVGPSTIYRWINAYNRTKLVSSLVPETRTGGKGKSRLSPEIDRIIKKAIEEHYLDNQRKSIQKVCIEVVLDCKNKGLTPPHYNTLRHRVAMISEYDKVKYRLGKKELRKRHEPKLGQFPDAIFPLSSIQIDHTPLDIIVVDEHQRRPIGRPWITLAIDTFSRMVVGLHISFERPSAMSVGLCIAHSILPKEEWLAQRDVFSEWSCWGVMKCVHVDNAKEFRSNMLKKACLEYGIEINWRPVKKPEFGGIIERMLGTLGTEIHSLSGTTFSRFSERDEYDSEGKAIFTLKELEKWLIHLIVDVYHNRYHETLRKSPYAKWKEGLLGDGESLGAGIPPRITNVRKVYLDFMPYEERTIQDYGVMIDNVCYYSDVFRRWINAVDPKSGKLKAKRKFCFKRDPRDISTVYFLDPELNEYFPIPYRDTSKPSISIWEFRAARERLIQDGLATVDEDAIFSAYRRMKEIEQTSKALTKKAKRLDNIKERERSHRPIIQKMEPSVVHMIEDKSDDAIIAFEDIDDGTSY